MKEWFLRKRQQLSDGLDERAPGSFFRLAVVYSVLVEQAPAPHQLLYLRPVILDEHRAGGGGVLLQGVLRR